MRRHCSSETMVTLAQWRSSGKVTTGDGEHKVTRGPSSDLSDSALGLVPVFLSGTPRGTPR